MLIRFIFGRSFGTGALSLTSATTSIHPLLLQRNLHYYFIRRTNLRVELFKLNQLIIRPVGRRYLRLLLGCADQIFNLLQIWLDFCCLIFIWRNLNNGLLLWGITTFNRHWHTLLATKFKESCSEHLYLIFKLLVFLLQNAHFGFILILMSRMFPSGLTHIWLVLLIIVCICRVIIWKYLWLWLFVLDHNCLIIMYVKLLIGYIFG